MEVNCGWMELREGTMPSLNSIQGSRFIARDVVGLDEMLRGCTGCTVCLLLAEFLGEQAEVVEHGARVGHQPCTIYRVTEKFYPWYSSLRVK